MTPVDRCRLAITSPFFHTYIHDPRHTDALLNKGAKDIIEARSVSELADILINIRTHWQGHNVLAHIVRKVAWWLHPASIWLWKFPPQRTSTALENRPPVNHPWRQLILCIALIRAGDVGNHQTPFLIDDVKYLDFIPLKNY